MFEAASARAGRLSSAAAENAKDLWRPRRGKIDLEREKLPDSFLIHYKGGFIWMNKKES